MKYVIDTNTVFDYPQLLERDDIILTSHVIREIERIESQKCFGNPELKRKIIEVKRYYDKNEEIITVDLVDYVWDINDTYDTSYEDNRILKCCIVNDYGLLTKDRLLRRKAKLYNIPFIKPEEAFENDSHLNYTGVIDFMYDESREMQEVLANLYQGNNVFELVENQYVCVWDLNAKTYDKYGEHNGYKHIDNFVCKDGKVKKVYYDNIDSKFVGEIKPVNAKQILAFNMLQDKVSTIKVIQGGFGVGKDFLMISHAISLLENPNSGIHKIIWIRNNVEVKDTNPLGFLPDGKMEKLLPFAMPLADHLGGVEGLTMLVDEKKIQIEHLGFMRGRDFKNAIIYVTECENNTKEHMQLLIGRVGEGSQLWVNGDLKQIDDKKFETNNGLNALKKLAGKHKFSLVTLDKVERSETAQLADLLD